MNIYEIIGKEDSELAGTVFGHFSTEELAAKGLETLPEEFAEECEIQQSNLPLNTVNIDGKDIDLTEQKEPKEIISSAEENISSAEESGYVEGYVTVHVSDIINNDHEEFLDLLSEQLVGNVLLENISYTIIGIREDNEIVFKVTGYLTEDKDWLDE